MTLSDLLIEHSAPTLAGIKCASLISLARLDSKESLPGKELREKGLSFMAIRTMKGKHLLLVYREKELMKALEDAKAKEILKQLGYDTSSLKASLNHLMERFQEESCPHEVGLFLGYPAEDVEGFIRDGGKNPMLSGLWKVYSSADRAIKLFSMYGRCRDIYRTMYRNGTSIARLCVSA